MNAPVRRHWFPVALWLAALLACVAVIAQTRIVADLSAFMPRAPSERQQMLMDQLKDGIVARLILVGIEGGDAPERARLSQALAATLRASPSIVGVQNGEASVQELDRAYFFGQRYLLSPVLTPERFSADGLREAIGATLDELSGSAGLMLKSLLPRDPTGETRALLEQFEGSAQPESSEGVWASRDGTRALLLVQTRTEGSDTDAQAHLIAQIRQAFADIPRRAPETRLLMTGTAVFSASSRTLIESEVNRLAIASLVLVAGLLLAVYRSPALLLLSLLPVLSGALAGVSAVSLGFGQVHGLTLGFGTTLIGEAVDYAIYLFIQRPNTLDASASRLFWRTLWLGTCTSVAGFMVLLGSGFPGLAQLGVYSTSGLLAAVLVTRYVLPALTPARFAVRPLPAIGAGIEALLRAAPRLRPLLVLALVTALAFLVLQPGAVWNRSLSGLNPVPKADQQLDTELRRDLGAEDMRYVAVLTAPDTEQALQAAERAGAVLRALTAAGTIGGFSSPAVVLPSVQAQRARQAALPEPAELRQRLAQALAGMPLNARKLDGFLADAEAARQRPLLTRADLDGTSAGLIHDSLLVPRAHDVLVLLPLRAVDAGTEGIIDIEKVDAALAQAGVSRAGEGREAVIKATVIDLLSETTALFDSYLHEALRFSAVGCLAIFLLLLATLRSPARALRVTLPLACAVLCVTAGTLAAGTTLTILHLVGLLLVVAVGSNYALFFDSTSAASSQQQRQQTALSLVVANLTTVGSFGMLGLSQVPVLAILGSTVGPGAFLALVFSAILARPAPATIPATRDATAR